MGAPNPNAVAWSHGGTLAPACGAPYPKLVVKGARDGTLRPVDTGFADNALNMRVGDRLPAAEIWSCVERAKSCAQQAAEARTERLRTEFLNLERRWLVLALSYCISAQTRRIADRG